MNNEEIAQRFNYIQQRKNELQSLSVKEERKEEGFVITAHMVDENGIVKLETLENCLHVKEGDIWSCKLEGEAGGIWIVTEEENEKDIVEMKVDTSLMLPSQFFKRKTTIYVIEHTQFPLFLQWESKSLSDLKEREIRLERKKEKWFTQHPFFTIGLKDGALIGTVKERIEKNVYLSYFEKNNQYTLPPTKMFLRPNAAHIYHVCIQLQKDETLQVIPMIITYYGKDKGEVMSLIPNTIQQIKLKEGVTSVRFCLRITGVGSFHLKDWSIFETKDFLTELKKPELTIQQLTRLQLVEKKDVSQLKIAGIMDVFTKTCYEQSCHVIPFSPTNWREQFLLERPDLLFVESAWEGNGGTWKRKVGYYSEEELKELKEVIWYCKNHQIPTVFWNKEDPVHFQRFIETAKLFDIIYTTDENMIPMYKNVLGHNRVYVLMFAAQPKMHNPVRYVEKREKGGCFAGSYYKHHKERTKDMEGMLDAFLSYGLTIYDRNYLLSLHSPEDNRAYPKKYHPYIAGNLPYYRIHQAYKGYELIINLNTVKDSPTMFARRVFEGLACGTPVVSNDSLGVKNVFGELVLATDHAVEFQAGVENLLQNESYYKQIAHLGMRCVLENHTYAHRLETIVQHANLPFERKMPFVAVVSLVRSPEECDKVITTFLNQQYPYKKLYLLLTPFEGYLSYFTHYNCERIHVYVQTCLDEEVGTKEWLQCDYWTVFHWRNSYGAHYLSDGMLYASFAKDTVMTKGTYVNEKGEKVEKESPFVYTSHLHFLSSIFPISLVETEALGDFFTIIESEELPKALLQRGVKILSIDEFNYVEGCLE